RARPRRWPEPSTLTGAPRRTAPASTRVTGSTAPPSGKSWASRSTFTTWYSTRNRLRKPLSLGSRMWRGIWPPSKAGETLCRAFVPLVPRPAVLPLEPSPRPTRVFLVFEPGAGRRWWILIVTGLLDLLDGDQVRHRPDHAADLRPVFLDHDVADPLQAERAQRLPLVPL